MIEERSQSLEGIKSDFAIYQRLTAETAIYPEGQAVEYCAMGLASEVGEVLGILKKVIRDDEQADEGKLKSELGDVLWYLARLCDECGFSLVDVADGNLEKLLSRQNRGVIGGSGDDR